MAKVEKSESWSVAGTTDDVEDAVHEVLADAGLKVIGSRPGLMEFKGGQFLKTRLLGTVVTNEKTLPKTARVQLDEVNGGVRVKLDLEENIGMGLIDSRTKKRYGKAFDEIAFALHTRL